MKIALITEWLVSASMMGGIGLLIYAHNASVRNEDLAAHSREVLLASESLVSRAAEPDGAGQRIALARLGELLGESADSEAGRYLERTRKLVQERAAAASLRGAVDGLQRIEAARLRERTAASRTGKWKSLIAELIMVCCGWLLFIWSSRRNRRHESINSAITKQLRRYVQDLERAHSIETETAADLMRLNEELAAAKNKAEHAMQARSQFLARISHDIRTPLSGIVGMSRLLMEGETKPENREYVLAIHSCANSLTQLLNDVLDLSKAESGKVVLGAAPFDLHALCSDIANLFRAAIDHKPVRLEFSYGPDTPRHVVGDQQRLRQVVTNIVGNAVKFTSEGMVGLYVSSAVTSRGGCRFRIKVTDTGIGIPTDRIQTIFDPYEQGGPGVAGRFGGTGLGLSICKHLAELMKGSIEVASVVGQGSVFTLTVPLVPTVAPNDPVPATANSEGESGTDGIGVRVLVADDNRVNQTICRRVLEKMGASVDVVANGAEAVEACRRSRYDVVLMDCNMPEMDGYEATQLLREDPEGRRLRIVALTADATPEGRRKCFEVGMDDWLLKPLKTESLKTVLRAVDSLTPA